MAYCIYSFYSIYRVYSIFSVYKNNLMKRYFLALVALLLSCLSASALELPAIFSDHMMLQQQTSARLWGWAKGGSTVEVTTSWDSQTYSAKADKTSGRWELQVRTPAASYDKQSLTVRGDGETRQLTDILVGEVWFCSGQSNMEMPIGGFWNCPVKGANETIAQANRYSGRIRCATIPKADALEPQDRVGAEWQDCSMETVSRFSACGYYFAETLTELLNVPVGIINCSWGGSCVEGWLPKEILLTYPDGLVNFDDQDYHRKMVMFNGMLNPLAGYTIKGFLWNQGESNVDREKEYADRFETMVRLWRKMWRQGEDPLPIYTVEIPGYSYGNVNGTNCADLRVVQHQIAHELENCGCVCTADLMEPWEAEQIHGCHKREIGQRLAWMAGTRDYGLKGIASESPEFDHMVSTIASDGDMQVVAGTAIAKNANEKGQVMRLYFTNAIDGFDRLRDIEGFEAAGADGVWHPAIVWPDSDWQDPTYQGCYLKLVCPEVSDIKNVRYHYNNFSVGGLRNTRGLPVVPFCTKF